MLQKMSELMENSELLDKAAECDVRSAPSRWIHVSIATVPSSRHTEPDSEKREWACTRSDARCQGPPA